MIIGDAIRPGKEADHLHRLERRRPRINRVGADVADDIGAQAHDPAVAVQRQLGVDDLIECLTGGDKVFEAIAGPLDRARQQP